MAFREHETIPLGPVRFFWADVQDPEEEGRQDLGGRVRATDVSAACMTDRTQNVHPGPPGNVHEGGDVHGFGDLCHVLTFPSGWRDSCHCQARRRGGVAVHRQRGAREILVGLELDVSAASFPVRMVAKPGSAGQAKNGVTPSVSRAACLAPDHRLSSIYDIPASEPGQDDQSTTNPTRLCPWRILSTTIHRGDLEVPDATAPATTPRPHGNRT